MHTCTFGLKFGSLSPAVTLKIRSRSPKPNQLFTMSQCYIRANSVKLHLPVHEISCKQKSVTPTLTLTPTLTPTPTGSAPKTICPPPLRLGGHNYNRFIVIVIVHTTPRMTMRICEEHGKIYRDSPFTCDKIDPSNLLSFKH